MNGLKKKIYRKYKQWQHSSFVATVVSWLYLHKVPAPAHKKIPQWQIIKGKPKIAFICDEMTWQDFRKECSSVFVTPTHWRTIFAETKPDIFFCESAWSGNEDYEDCWRGRIYKNEKVKWNSRKALRDILHYCKENRIPTVFWNKEDPTFFDNKTYNFVDTALLFDHIFTTAQECVKAYQKKGHHSVHVLPFGYAPDIFYSDLSQARTNKAVFAGSWYADQPERCRDMTDIFDMVLAHGIVLEIWDRQSNSYNPVHKFPPKYTPHIRPAVAFEQLGHIYRGAEYAININTVKDSSTMFARRVVEVMACGCIVISNESAGMRELFDNRIWFLGETFSIADNEEIRQKNRQEIEENDTCKQRLAEVLAVCGISQESAR